MWENAYTTPCSRIYETFSYMRLVKYMRLVSYILLHCVVYEFSRAHIWIFPHPYMNFPAPIYETCHHTHASHVHTHVRESWHTCEGVMAHIFGSHGTHVRESWHICERVMAHMWGSHSHNVRVRGVWHLWWQVSYMGAGIHTPHNVRVRGVRHHTHACTLRARARACSCSFLLYICICIRMFVRHICNGHTLQQLQQRYMGFNRRSGYG